MKTLLYMWRNRYHTRCANIPFAVLPYFSIDLKGQEQLAWLHLEFPLPFYDQWERPAIC